MNVEHPKGEITRSAFVWGMGSVAKLAACTRTLAKTLQGERRPTMPKFVDPGDPPSFQETMWKKGYKCVGGDWQEYYSG